MNFYETLTAAINFFSENGYSSSEDLLFWQNKLKQAAKDSMLSEAQLQEQLLGAYRAIYSRMVDKGQLLKFHQGICRFTLEKVRPQLRAELDRRIMASADLIKLNRESAVQKTLQRFSGWATSIPQGGSENVGKVEEKTNIRKSLKQLPFAERRCIVDQSHKLVANISRTLAEGSGAIAVTWHSHWRQAGYDYRQDHKDRDQKTYALRDNNWAIQQGFMKAGSSGYYEDITAVAEEPFCRCQAVYRYSLRSMPKDMLTQKGIAELERVKISA